MKNKDIYNLTELDITVNYRIDGCGKRILSPCYVDIKYKGEYIVRDLKAVKSAINTLMVWLEEDIPPISDKK